MFPATSSNQITKEYYFFLVGEINRGVTTKTVCRVLRKNGTHEYYTYHLTSVL